MGPFATLLSPALALLEDNLDTDIIFPARFLLITTKTGLARYAFYERRYVEGRERADFPLNREPARSAQVLLTGENFGCGSSREQAVWALHDLGFRCIVAPSFGEIFRANCFKSGVLPIILPRALVQAFDRAAADGGAFTVDLKARLITPPGGPPVPFEIEDWRRQALLQGWDEVMMTMNLQGPEIDAFEAAQRERAPWLYTA